LGLHNPLPFRGLRIRVLSGLGDLYHNGHIQAAAATLALLARLNPRKLAFEVDLGWNRVCANRAVRPSCGVFFNESSHGLSLTSSDANSERVVVPVS
jgi:hypothetical protein